MTETQFSQLRQPDWDRYSALLTETVSGARKIGATELPTLYRRICQDLNQARAAHYSPALVERLNHLVWSGHERLYRGSDTERQSVFELVFFEFPRMVRQHARAILLGHLFFYGLGAIVFAYILLFPHESFLALGSDQKADLAAMYDPQAEHFLHPRHVTDSADMFGFYIQHNISIGFQVFAGGALAGVGSLFFLAYNAFALGSSAAFIVQLGYEKTFFPFVVGHSAFEITALILFAVCGLQLGWAFLSPGRLRRSEAFLVRARDSLPIVYGGFLFLLLAASIEAFWSSLVLDPVVKFSVGGGLWLFVLAFFIFGGRRRV